MDLERIEKAAKLLRRYKTNIENLSKIKITGIEIFGRDKDNELIKVLLPIRSLNELFNNTYIEDRIYMLSECIDNHCSKLEEDITIELKKIMK